MQITVGTESALGDIQMQTTENLAEFRIFAAYIVISYF